MCMPLTVSISGSALARSSSVVCAQMVNAAGVEFFDGRPESFGPSVEGVVVGGEEYVEAGVGQSVDKRCRGEEAGVAAVRP